MNASFLAFLVHFPHLNQCKVHVVGNLILHHLHLNPQHVGQLSMPQYDLKTNTSMPKGLSNDEIDLHLANDPNVSQNL